MRKGSLRDGKSTDVQTTTGEPALPRRAHMGRRALAWAAVVALCCALPPFANNAIGYVPLGLALLMPLASLAQLKASAGHVGAQPMARVCSCKRGEEAQVGVSVSNESALVCPRVEPVFSIGSGDGSDQQTRARAALAPRSHHDFSVGARFDHVGSYEVGVAGIEVFDPIGLFSHMVPSQARCLVRCCPRTVVIDRMASGVLTTADAARNVRTALSDDMDYAFVREYEQGDPMKTVHWKMSARGDDKLYTKLFESHTNPGTTVALDFTSEEPDEETRACLYDALLECAYSVIAYARKAGVRTTLAFLDKTGAPRLTSENSADRLNALIDEMPRLAPARTPGAVADLLRAEAQSPDANANILLVTSDPARPTVEALLAQHALRRGVRVLRVRVPGSGHDQGAGAREASFRALADGGVPVSIVAGAEDLAGAVEAAEAGTRTGMGR